MAEEFVTLNEFISSDKSRRVGFECRERFQGGSLLKCTCGPQAAAWSHASTLRRFLPAAGGRDPKPIQWNHKNKMKRW